MATFVNSPVQWPGSQVHLVMNSVYERSAKFAWCGEKIGPDAQYDGELVPNCARCLASAAGDAERNGK